MSEPGGLLTFLAVPVAEAELVVRTALRRFQPAVDFRLGLSPEVIVAHVTVAGPFLPPEHIDPGVLDAIRQLCAQQSPFAFSLAQLGVFPNGVVYLAPEPPQPFKTLMQRFEEHWPELPIYGGQYPDPVPHVTIASERHTPEQVAEVAAAVQPHLPIQARAHEVQLVLAGEQTWRPLERFPLGGSGA